MNTRLIALILMLLAGLGICATAAADCQTLTFEDAPYTVCQFDAQSADIRLFHSGPDGTPFGQFEALSRALVADGLELVFAMNGGMYHLDRQPVGLYVESGSERSKLVLSEGPGNFHMQPNGVFWLDAGRAGIDVSEYYADTARRPEYATQSGPMLVIDGDLHPKLRADGRSKFRRNGVGVSGDGRTVSFAISEVPVNFHSFARLFRDHLQTPNALYLDGRVSKLYSRQLERNEAGLDMGPIIAVVVASGRPASGE